MCPLQIVLLDQPNFLITELPERGEGFIEGMAQAFEGRNYLVMFSALIATLFSIYNIWLGIIIGLILVSFVKTRIKGKMLTKMADISEGDIRFEGPNPYVSDIHIKNVGLGESRKVIMERAVGAIIT